MDVFAAVADPVRRSLLSDLASAPCRVADLAEARPISRPAVSRHLRLLLEAGVVTVSERGRERYYALDPSGLAPVREYVDRLAPRRARVTPQSLDALETEVRRTTRARRGAAARAIRPATEETA